jgi:ParB family transcriptional regulator, chromosome partitioning protein
MSEIASNDIKQIELEINFYKGQAVQSIFEIGERLIKAKELVPHGEWGNWLESKVDISQWTANKFMRVAREFSNYGSINNLTQTKVFALLEIPKEKREDFIEDNPVEDMTARELRQAIKEKKELEEKVRELKNNPVVKEVEKIPDDYNKYKETAAKMQNEALNLRRQLEDRKLEIDRVNKEKDILERKAKLNQDESDKYESLKRQIESLSKEKNDLGRQIKARTELSGLVVRIEHTLKTDLAPIKYSRAISEASSDEIVLNNLRDITQRVQEWVDDMKQYISDPNIVEVLNYEDVR